MYNSELAEMKRQENETVTEASEVMKSRKIPINHGLQPTNM